MNVPNYLKEHALPMCAVTDYTDFSDLEPLAEILKQVRIVGLGESTHGTREFFQLKHRVTRFLVERMGYRVFTIEAGMLPCMNINEFAIMGKGKRAEALASQGYWTWDTEEVSDMIDWMRAHNLSCARGEECRFIGYDIKPVAEAAEALLRITELACPELNAKVKALCDSIAEHPVHDSERASIDASHVTWLMGAITARELIISAKAGRDLYELAVTSCRMIYQYIDGMLLSDSLEGRDKHMAENIMRIMDDLPSDARIVVWAHNAHIAVDPEWRNMGYHLRQKYGSQYYPFALTFTRGTFQSRLIPADDDGYKPFGALQEFDAGEPRPGFWERELMQVRGGDYYLDLRAARTADEETLAWSRQKLQVFGAGGGYIPIPADAPADESFFDAYDLSTQFDGLFHIEKTTRARPTPTGMRKDGQAAK